MPMNYSGKILKRVVLILLCLYSSSAFALPQNDLARILVLHSYDPSYHWTKDLQEGIESSLSNSSREVKLSVEYMDSKRNLSSNYLESFKQYFTAKYKHYKFDGVIITDDNAANLFLELYPRGIKDTPVVAVGINNALLNASSLSRRAKVFYSQDNINSNLTLIKRIIPNVKKIYLFHDLTTSGKLLSEQVKQEHAKSDISNVPLLEITDLSLEEAKKFAQTLKPNDVILLTHFNTQLNDNVYYTYNQVSKALGQESNAPIFVLWNFYLRNGVLGGYVNHSKRLGELAVETLSAYLDLGVLSNNNIETSYRPIIDYSAVVRHQIDPKLLPENSLFLNKPVSIWQEYQKAIIVITTVFVALLIVIFLQGAWIRNKRIIANHTRKILTLRNKTLAVQKEMILMLGEAIETRSGETGNHVKRVAQMSALLGKLYGLSHREVEMLEIVSPMHDVGKIGISEAILEKPGKLDNKEWGVMKTHTSIGYEMLSKSEGELFSLAAFVAHEHHERWDGKGYPNALFGENIHVFARLTSLADVFDALLSRRCYKEPWEMVDVIALFEEEAGKQFDPTMSSLLLHNIDDFIALRSCYPDERISKD
ncbi:HD domain-containing protein [Vibrio sp. YMD68]|uniref:HD domain-containing phosphohydrolase n=1 Tax=Vibrio sp. YMD68 TaxID=3042300 RepID=UPI00249B701D|nr:HD domain-containing phosphohydrolase [Vibrio sp. YMD68]WGV98762.1 HD domain-containing protein [Vibrio sp. YMD68]